MASRRFPFLRPGVWFVVLLIIVLVASDTTTSSGDHFYDCRLLLAADRQSYSIGDEIDLTFTIIPKRKKSIRLYQRMEDTIVVRWLDRGEYRPRDPHGAICRFDLRPDAPLVVHIHGHVQPADEPNKVMLDFSGYGHVLVSTDTPTELSANAYPAKFMYLDSVEWSGSNSVQLTFSPSH